MGSRAVQVEALEAPRLHLRRLVDGDIDAIVHGCNNANVSRYTALIPYPYTLSDAREFLTGAMLDRNAHTRHVFGIETRIGGDLIGCIEINMGDGGDTFGYWLGEDHWGKGYITEAILEMQRFAFEIAGKAELCAAVNPKNPASARVLEKTGFTYDRIETGLPGRCADVEAQIFVLKAEDWKAREAKKPKLLVSAVALVRADGCVLMATRPPGKALAGLWEFPGGKVHTQETPEQALVRELREELSIGVYESDLTALTFASHPYEHFHLIMPLYLCRVWQGDVTAMEGQSLKWVKPAKLHILPMPPADIPLVALLKDLL
ncbi:MAG: NTP pyrophosphohydrolase [Rhodospirillaceae bacterium]|nr:MAG: NTP pyrophosphohydrolase [Rhodospirillaceae bacterium]